MGDKLKRLLKKGVGVLRVVHGISLENTPTSHVVSLALVMYTYSSFAMPLSSCICLLHATANSVCVH